MFHHKAYAMKILYIIIMLQLHLIINKDQQIAVVYQVPKDLILAHCSVAFHHCDCRLYHHVQ